MATAGASRTRRIEDLKPKRGVSPLGDALREVLASHRGRPVAGVVLVTDGRSNAGEDLIRAATKDAKDKVEAHMAAEMGKLTGGLGLPPGMKLPF